MDLAKLLDVTDLGNSDSLLSKNTSILKSLSSSASSTISTASSHLTNNNDENLEQLIYEVTKQDLILNIINKCVEENETCKSPEEHPLTNGKVNKTITAKANINKHVNGKAQMNKLDKVKSNNNNNKNNNYPTLDTVLKSKIRNIIKFNDWKDTFDENNLGEILAFINEDFDPGREENDLKLDKQEADQLNEVVEKCIDQMYMNTILEKRAVSTKSSIDRIQELQSKIQAKYLAIEDLYNSIAHVQDKMLHLSTKEYQKTVIQDNQSSAMMTLGNVNKLHAEAVLSVGAVAARSDTTQPPPDVNQFLLGLDDSISSLEYSIESVKLEIADLEERLAQHKQLESNPESAALYKSVRKLQNAIKHKKFILKQLVGNSE